MADFMFENEFTIGKEKRLIGDNEKPFLVAEIGLNHNNDLEIGKKTIEAAKKNGADAVKFQSYITEEFIDQTNLQAKFLFDIFKQYELSERMHIEFQKTAQDNGLVFFSTPLCESSVDLLVSLDVPLLKVASGDIVNAGLLEKCISTNIPIFLSTGAAEMSEIVRTLEFMKKKNVTKLCLLHCVSVYPAPLESLNLKNILLLKEIGKCPVGFSDHSEGSVGACVAIAYDACVIEKHFTLDKNLPGPDHSISASPAEFSLYSKNCSDAFHVKGRMEKILHEKEMQSKFFGSRSLYIDGKKKPIALRPNLHVQDNSVLQAWDYLKLREFKTDLSAKQVGEPLYFKDIK